jgi:release factor glutamine methyltransferase
VQYDPPAALFGGADGLDAYRALLPLARHVLKPHGHLVIEIGARQEEAVTELLASADFELEARNRDLSKIVRCLVARPI